MLRALAAATLLLTVTACGGSSAHPSASPPRSSTPAPTPSRSAAPDDEQVTVLGSGIGTFDLQAYPIALLTNQASSHTATDVVVTFTVQLRGGSYSLAAEPVSLAPGEAQAVTVLCTDKCDGATGATVGVTVGGWAVGTRTVISGTAPPYACGSPCRGSDGGYEGSVSGSVSGAVQGGTLVTVTALCRDGGGNIVGGGSASTVWPQSAASAPATVSVLTSVEPGSCQLYATEVS